MKITVHINKIREYAADPAQRIGQRIINNDNQPTALLKPDEIMARQELFYVNNENFWHVFSFYSEYFEVEYSMPED